MYDEMDFGSNLMQGAAWGPGCGAAIVIFVIGVIIYVLAATSCSEQCESLGAKLTVKYDYCLCVKPDGTLIDPNL